LEIFLPIETFSFRWIRPSITNFPQSVVTNHPCERNHSLRTDGKDRLHMGSQ
jgi:hypothetical protein